MLIYHTHPTNVDRVWISTQHFPERRGQTCRFVPYSLRAVKGVVTFQDGFQIDGVARGCTRLVGRSEKNIVVSDATKRCTKCSRTLNAGEFSKRTNAKDGLSSICRYCKAEYRKKCK